jgi:hypothetical protein
VSGVGKAIVTVSLVTNKGLEDKELESERKEGTLV